jgi:transposase InsO family protein
MPCQGAVGEADREHEHPGDHRAARQRADEEQAAVGAERVERRGQTALVGRRGNTIHHSDAGQYTAMHFTETLMLNGLIPSVGTVGNCLLTG